MSNLIDLPGGSYTPAEIFQAIAESNDPAPVDLTDVTTKLDLISSRLSAIEGRLATLPTNWSFS
jgi:hypothetical protein